MRYACFSLCLLVVSACGSDSSEPGGCPWFQSCGTSVVGGIARGVDCGTCDDEDACTVDSCVEGQCRHVTLVDTCACTPSCEGPDGRLAPVQTLTHGQGGLPEPRGLLDLAVSADEQHAYGAARDSGAVAHFVRTQLGGGKAGWRFGEATPAGPIESLALLDQGQALVAAGPAGVGLFLRDTETGRVVGPTWLGDPAQGVETTGSRVVTVGDSRLTVLQRTGNSLEVLGVATAPVLEGARRLALSPDGSRVAVAALDASTVTVWDVAGESPVEISRLSDGAGLDRPADVAWSRDGGSLYVAGYCDHDIAILSATETLSWVGSVYETDPLAVGCVWLSGQDETTGEDVGSDARLPNPVALEVSPDGKTLAVAGPSVGFDVLLYDLDEASGPSLRGYMDGRPTVDGVMEISNTPLSQLDDPTDLVLPPEHAWSVSLTSAGDHLYAASFWSDAWTAIDISANESAAQGFVQRGHNGVSWLLGAYNLELSPDDRHLYVAPRLVGTVKPFAVDATTGGLTELESPPEPVFGDEAGSVSNVHVAPDGSQVFAIDSLYAKLLVYDRDADTGLLTLRSHAPLPDCEGQPAFPVDVAVSPDGTHVFVADFQYGVSCMDVFPRQDGGVGEPLQLAESVLEGIENFVFSADARHVYAACLGGTVAHYLRDDQGGLTAQPTVEIDALVGAEFTVMSPDERWLYVASPVADKVIVFSRALETGTLTLHQIVNDSNQGSRLEGAAGLAITPDGRHLYVTARIHDAINHFSVGTDGKLSLEAVVQGQPGQEWVNGLAMRSDGAMLYSSAVDAHAVMAWRVIRGDQDGCLGICPTQ